MRNTLLKPILSLSVLMGASGCFTQGYAEDIVIVDGLWKISYIENDHAFRVLSLIHISEPTRPY